jgi:hypothetical protein
MMAHFIRATDADFNDDFLVNLDHVVKIEHHVSGYALFDDEASILGYATEKPPVGVIVPAAKGMTAIIIGVHAGSQRPSLEDVWWCRRQIVAWQVDGDTATPVVDGPIGEGSVFVERDEHLVSMDFSGSLSEVKENALNHALLIWDHRAERIAAKKEAERA